MPKVFLSAGHGGKEPGAVAAGIQEKNVNLAMMLECAEVLLRHGVDVVCSRKKDENDNVYEEVKEANASGADIALSIHNNAGGGDGFEAFYYKTSTEGKKIAQLCEKRIKAIGQNSRGIKTDNLYFTRETTMPAVLVEGYFMDNPTDRKIADTDAERKSFGVAYAKAIMDYFGIEYKRQEETPEKIYRVQVGAFKDKRNAVKLVAELSEKGYTAFVTEV